MHTLLSVAFPDRMVTIEVDRQDVTQDEDQIFVMDRHDAHWSFERRHVLYSMLSEVTDEQFEILTAEPEPEPDPEPEPEPTAGRRKSRTYR